MCSIEEIKNVFEEKYAISVSKLVKSEESTDGNVYLIYAISGDRFVLKIYDSKVHAISMVKLHKHVASLNLGVPAIISNCDNCSVTNIADMFIVCYSFIDGSKLKEVDFSEERIIAIAQYLRKLHNINANNFGIETVSMSEVLGVSQTSVDDSKYDRNSLLHFDITKHNIFVKCVQSSESCSKCPDSMCNGVNSRGCDMHEKIYFIDFDDSRFGPSVCDVAIALTNLFISKANGVDRVGMKTFIDAYYGEQDELKSLELPFIKKAAIGWLESVINKQELNSSIVAGLQNKLNFWKYNDIFKEESI